jgi:hypothetical protein
MVYLAVKLSIYSHDVFACKRTHLSFALPSVACAYKGMRTTGILTHVREGESVKLLACVEPHVTADQRGLNALTDLHCACIQDQKVSS